jgi:hypothetical protein
MRTITIEAEVEEVRKTGELYQVWVYVGDYRACVWLTESEARARGLVQEPKDEE